MLDLVIIVPADILVPNGEDFKIWQVLYKLLWLTVIMCIISFVDHMQIFENSQWGLAISPVTSGG